MQMLYDSDSFVVLHLKLDLQDPDALAPSEASATPSTLPRNGFEIVDKRSGKEVYLDGSWAELFMQQIQAWQKSAPSLEEVEDTLEGYAQLAQNPVRVH